MPQIMASTEVQTVSTPADKAKIGLAVALLVAALAGFYLLAKQGPIVQWLTLVA
ncbi:MAG: preprotein translocase subunit SecE, partial [Betaproteobacteria bacterium]|nr:preprotein translocase subunit SecE [Betaproteobacteria bacterium]